MNNKIYSISILRGISALSILIYHLFVFFFKHQPFSASLVHSNPVTLPIPFYMNIILPFDLGYTGVAFFFLITGFLIEHSLKKHATFSSYIQHKFIRLWPTYALCFSTGLIFVALFSFLMNNPFPYSFPHILSYYSWTRDIFNYKYIDGVIWTLEIQIKFYLLAGITWFFWKKEFLTTFFFFLMIGNIIFLAYQYNYIETPFPHLIKIIGNNLKHYFFIILGTIFYNYHHKKISIQKALFLSILSLSCFVFIDFGKYYGDKLNSFLLGYLVFVIFISLTKNKTYKKNLLFKFLTLISNISYPLYLTHVLPGYVIIYYGVYKGYGVYSSIMLAFFVTFILSYSIHRFESCMIKADPTIKSFDKVKEHYWISKRKRRNK